ncbi:flavin reductase family protein [Sphingobium sp. YR768]|uniref:flavin reductase family protein n=1 Tax=Sphingobium sp. YR768 TaxID=1884365 RepID=UPI0008D36794|nr:flavin reductase family protein [Sphingobium sp. YR768]SER79912.1 NADH-FMN oxidoreductase RutF, flavin reductase (DIM6/NTAB) family [Sphingobium sp. YR768]
MIDPSLFREAMSTFPTGVTVVTALGEDGGITGFTASAFTSLSLDPPLVLICPARTSVTYANILARRSFAIHFLSDEQEAVAYAFASKGPNKLPQSEWRLSANVNPVLHRHACLIECTLWQEYDGGDHAIVVGAVQSIQQGDADALFYYRGSMFSGAKIPQSLS